MSLQVESRLKHNKLLLLAFGIDACKVIFVEVLFKFGVVDKIPVPAFRSGSDADETLLVAISAVFEQGIIVIKSMDTNCMCLSTSVIGLFGKKR